MTGAVLTVSGNGCRASIRHATAAISYPRCLLYRHRNPRPTDRKICTVNLQLCDTEVLGQTITVRCCPDDRPPPKKKNCTCRFVQPLPASSVKTRAPSRNCRNANVYGRTTTATHHNSESADTHDTHDTHITSCPHVDFTRELRFRPPRRHWNKRKMRYDSFGAWFVL